MVHISGSSWAICFNSNDAAVTYLHRMSFVTLSQVGSLIGHVYTAVDTLRECKFEDMGEDVILLTEKLGLLVPHFANFFSALFVLVG